MVTFLMYTLFIVACFILIGVVLLQSGKADAAAVFGGGGQAAFGPRGTTTLLQKITIGAAVTFMIIAFLFSLGVGSPKSAAGSVSDRPAAQTPEPPKSSAAPAAVTEPKKDETQAEGTTPQSERIQVTQPPASGSKDQKPAAKDQGKKEQPKK